MGTPNPQFDEIAFALIDGDEAQVDLTCPKCQEGRLIFSFTVRELPDQFGFFLVCPHCKTWRHYSLISQPKNFHESKILPEFQRLEDEAVNAARAALGKPTWPG
ncbi:MAG: hypothetical protein ACFLMY_09465 [Candidatus Brachytrichaceae bacterium NZ_4S206]|jgi:hypothetical protein